MLVKDLIYLLHTRGNPQHEVVLTYFDEPVGDSIRQNFIELKDNFDTVGTDEDETCMIFFEMPKKPVKMDLLKKEDYL